MLFQRNAGIHRDERSLIVIFALMFLRMYIFTFRFAPGLDNHLKSTP